MWIPIKSHTHARTRSQTQLECARVHGLVARISPNHRASRLWLKTPASACEALCCGKCACVCRVHARQSAYTRDYTRTVSCAMCQLRFFSFYVLVLVCNHIRACCAKIHFCRPPAGYAIFHHGCAPATNQVARTSPLFHCWCPAPNSITWCYAGHADRNESMHNVGCVFNKLQAQQNLEETLNRRGSAIKAFEFISSTTCSDQWYTEMQ